MPCTKQSSATPVLSSPRANAGTQAHACSCRVFYHYRCTVDAATIDEINILRASLHAMHRCVEQLPSDAQGAVLVC